MRITMTISAPDMTTMTTELTQDQDGSQWDGHVEGIPAGVGRAFKAEAYDSTNVVIYAVTMNDVTINKGLTTEVILTLQDVNPNPGPENDTPIISGISLSSDQVAPGAAVNLSVTASDPNSNDTISYLWDAACDPAGPAANPNGAFSAADIANPTWTAPAYSDDVTAVCSLSITVSDSNTSVKTFFNIQVSGAFGKADIANTQPLISMLKADLVYANGAQNWDFALIASDPSGGGLAYEWYSPNCNTGDAVWNMSAPYTITTPHFTYTNSTANCNFKVVVTDLFTAGGCGAASIGEAGALPDGAPRCGQVVGLIYGYLPVVARVLP